MIFLASQSFLSEVNQLHGKSKYNCILKSLFSEFHNRTDQELIERGSTLHHINDKYIKKKRLLTCNNGGKRGGFRTIAAVDAAAGVCGLLMIYPKVGPDRKNSATKSEGKTALASYLKDKDSDCLMEMNFNVQDESVYFTPIKLKP